MGKNGINVNGLTFGYLPDRPLFAGFEIASDARVTILKGPSGCGKTTLLKLLSGDLAVGARAKIERPSSPYLVLQADILPRWKTPRGILAMFAPSMIDTIESSTLFPLIADYWDRRTAELSFGQRRAFELVCAFERRAPLLLLDEPHNFLDRARRRLFVDFLNDPEKCPGPVVLTSHFDDEARVADAAIYEFVGNPPYARLERRSL